MAKIGKMGNKNDREKGKTQLAKGTTPSVADPHPLATCMKQIYLLACLLVVGAGNAANSPLDLTVPVLTFASATVYCTVAQTINKQTKSKTGK